ncbi:MAG: hypothetical protein KDC84_14585 [Crocinitomicaceae bacterium]|nr:hypothetical protein [Crocinitomicaceae bacterium]
MELKKSNVFMVLGVVCGLLFTASCSSGEAKKEEKTSEQKPEIKLNNLLAGTFEIRTEFKEVKDLGANTISSPIGNILRQEALVYDEQDTVKIYATRYDTLPATKIHDLFFGEIYRQFGEEKMVAFDTLHDQFARVKFGDTLVWEYRVGMNWTVLLESKKVVEKVLEVGVLEVVEDSAVEN